MSDIYAGDNGTVLEVTISDAAGAVNLTTATTIIAYFVKPGGTFEKTLAVTGATTGKCSVSLTSSNINVAGTYTFQVEVTFLDATFFHGGVQRFKVAPALRT